MAPGPIDDTPARPGRRIAEFSPTRLRRFQECPERFYRQYIGRERATSAFSRGMQRGSAVHKTLATVFNARRDEMPDPAVRPLAEQFLTQPLYQRAAMTGDWPADVLMVEQLVEKALSVIPVEAEVLRVEEQVDFVLGTSSPAPGARLVSKVDLLIKHPEQVLEHIEFKTGSAGRDLYQDVISRIGVVERYRQTGLPILSTVMQLTTGEEFQLDGDRDVFNAVYPEIVGTVREIWDAEQWPARENDACQFCEYRATICSIHGELSAPNRLSARCNR